MVYCSRCGTNNQDAHHYCWNCGAQMEQAVAVPAKPAPRWWFIPSRPHAPGSLRRFGQIFGLDPRLALLTLIVDMMLNAGDLVTMGLLLPVSIMAGIVLGYIAYRAQINWYGDDKESAKIKGLIIGLLTAIPTPLPELLYVPAALLGLFHGWLKKESHS